MRYVIPFIYLLSLVACSPSKRLERLEKKHPELFKKTVDTVHRHHYKIDTLTLQTTKIDTQISIDTFLKTKIIKITKRDTVYKTIKIIDKDTFYITRTKTLSIEKKNDHPIASLINSLSIFLILLLIFVTTIARWKN